MGLCIRHRIWLILVALLKWHDNALGLWFMKEPVSRLPDEVDHALAVCQGSNMILNCRNRYNKIVVKNTFYGRKNNHTCASKIFDTEKLCDVPTPDLIKQKIDLMCTGEYKCKVPITPAFLEKKGQNMCPSSRKYVQITYACHQDPKLHMVCYNNCSSKCWPLCQNECCEPKQAETRAAAVEKKIEKSVKELTKVPQELTCHGNCPNRCAPQCDVTCCETKPVRAEPLVDTKVPERPTKETKTLKVSSCIGDCQNICAPLCRPSCCARHKKSAAAKYHTHAAPKKPSGANYHQFPHASPITKPFVTQCSVDCHGHCLPKCPPICCAQIPKAGNPYYVEPLSARMQYMTNNRYQVQPGQTYANQLAQAPQAPQAPQSRAGYYGPPLPGQPYAQYAQPQVAQPGYTSQAVARDAYQQPLINSQTLEVEVPNTAYNRDNPAQTYQRVPQAQELPPGCAPSCARSCDASCKLGCCGTPLSPFYFTTNTISDDEQRRSYELLLQKYRNNQLQKYYQSVPRVPSLG